MYVSKTLASFLRINATNAKSNQTFNKHFNSNQQEAHINCEMRTTIDCTLDSSPPPNNINIEWLTRPKSMQQPPSIRCFRVLHFFTRPNMFSVHLSCSRGERLAFCDFCALFAQINREFSNIISFIHIYVMYTIYFIVHTFVYTI